MTNLSSDPNEGSMVLFRRFEDSDWETGFIADTFWVDGAGRAYSEPDLENPTDREAWVRVVPAAPDCPDAPTSLTVPLNVDRIDPIVHGMELPR